LLSDSFVIFKASLEDGLLTLKVHLKWQKGKHHQTGTLLFPGRIKTPIDRVYRLL